MILEAFSQRLKKQYHPGCEPEAILHDWLSEQLDQPAGENSVRRVIQAEVSRVRFEEQVWFAGNTPSGARMLESLYHYCKSFDNWQFTRWLHEVRASDFSGSL